MAVYYLEELETRVRSGRLYYGCVGARPKEWHIAGSIEELRLEAQRIADLRNKPTDIFRLVDASNVFDIAGYLIVRRIVETRPTARPRLEWTLVDTKQAAEMLRDVSRGSTPYFAIVFEESILPKA